MKTQAAVLSIILTAAVLVAAGTLLAAPMTGLIKVESAVTATKTGTVSSVTETLVSSYKWGGTTILGTGTTAAAMSVIYTANATIPGLGTNTLDLVGTLSNNFGETINLTKVKWMQFAPSNSMTTVAQSILVEPAPENGFATWMSGTTSAMRVYSGGAVAIFAPCTNAFAVTATTGDLLQIRNESTNAVTVQVIIAGE
jgi:hypothetical protein